jgi:hypothetical protein
MPEAGELELKKIRRPLTAYNILAAELASKQARSML